MVKNFHLQTIVNSGYILSHQAANGESSPPPYVTLTYAADLPTSSSVLNDTASSLFNNDTVVNDDSLNGLSVSNGRLFHDGSPYKGRFYS